MVKVNESSKIAENKRKLKTKVLVLIGRKCKVLMS